MARAFDLEWELVGLTPRIWRRVRVPASATLLDLHHVMQAVMGWEDQHLHLFEVAGREYCVPPDEDWERDAWEGVDEATMTLSQVVAESGGLFHYVYDFGNDWRVALRSIDDVVVPGPPQARIVGGERAAPPEDIGGPAVYQQILDAWSSGNRRHLPNDVRESLPRRFDPWDFDLPEAAARLRAAMPLDPTEEATPIFADADEQLIADLTLLTLYLGSWEESSGLHMSWKTLRFEVLDVLKREGLIDTTPARKSVIITEHGVRRAARLRQRVAGTINDGE
jgi:hypothetical protein